ncbi:hypothetical protein HZB00_03465 [Candidatus Woesearchaeota archaeon]|nr:hypothetical protein [Candidatus Woesearchaeota archaeon]
MRDFDYSLYREFNEKGRVTRLVRLDSYTYDCLEYIPELENEGAFLTERRFNLPEKQSTLRERVVSSAMVLHPLLSALLQGTPLEGTSLIPNTNGNLFLYDGCCVKVMESRPRVQH